MPTPREMRDVITKYLDFYNSGNADSLVALFAGDALVEDPVGTGKVHSGRDAVDAFYRSAVGKGTRLELKGTIRGSHGNAAALALEVHASLGARAVRVAVIDVVTFDEGCRITNMKCYWAPDDVTYC